MSELKVITAILLVFGVIGVLAQVWMWLAPPLFYRLHSAEIVGVSPGYLKLRIDRTATVFGTAYIAREIHCKIGDAEIVAPVDGEPARPITPGRSVFDTTLTIPAQAFNGEPTAQCYLEGVMRFQPLAGLPWLTVHYRTLVIEAQRPV